MIDKSRLENVYYSIWLETPGGLTLFQDRMDETQVKDYMKQTIYRNKMIVAKTIREIYDDI